MKLHQNPGQLTLFDAALGEQQAEDAIARAEASADEDWMQTAIEAVELIARFRRFFTTDEVWKVLAESGAATHEPRAMGAVMRQAVTAGTCRKAPLLPQKSAMAACHRRPKQVWESLIVAALAAATE
jgi:hypothetical protein